RRRCRADPKSPGDAGCPQGPALMKIILTGASGFLGWHTRLRLHALTEHEVVPVTRASWPALPQLITDADALIHIAGVNRDADVDAGNVRLAEDRAAALATGTAPISVVYASSIQAGSGTPYGSGKAAAAEILHHVANSRGGRFSDVLLPNLFGEHGRPR